MKTLSERLKRIIEFAGKCAVVADIGTDHALVPVYMIECGHCSRAYACDIRDMPLKRAEQYVVLHGLSDRISVFISDGLENVPQDADTVIIAGMGGELIKDIIDRDKAHVNSVFILQPMTSADKLRKYLYENGFEILDEEIVAEHSDKKLYSIMKVIREEKAIKYSYIDTLVSPVLRSKDSIEKRLYIEKMIFARKKILEDIKNASYTDERYIFKIKSEIKDLEECI